MIAVAILAFLVLAVAPASFAETIDQSNTGVKTRGFFSIKTGLAKGQSFRPGLPLIDFARFVIHDMNGNTPRESLVVDLHQGRETGPILATSSPQATGPGAEFRMEFRFDPTVTLVPNQTYTLMFRVLGTANWGVLITENTYPHGYLVGWNGDTQDAWFEEGTHAVPAEALSWGRLKASYR